MKNKKILVFISLVVVSIVIVLLLIPTTSSGKAVGVSPKKEMIFPLSSKPEEKSINSEKTLKNKGNESREEAVEKSVVSDLRTSPGIKKDIKGRLFILKLKQDLPKFSDDELNAMREQLIESDKVDPADFALEFVSSTDKKTKEFGMELLRNICIKRVDAFRPNEFYKVFGKEGLQSGPILSEIIRDTDDDFIREWACELWEDIYFYNSASDDDRHLAIANCKKNEENIYNFLKEVLADPEEVKKVEAKRGPLGDIIIKEWGSEKRMPLKMIELISIFDLMDKKRPEPSIANALNVLNTYNFNYDILGRLNNKPLDRPALPEVVKLKKLSDAVLKKEFSDTYRWVAKGEGGFTYSDLTHAVAAEDQTEIKRMLLVFRKIITDILRAKLLIGLGQNEIKQLRYFYQKTWDGKPFNWENKMLVLHNTSGKRVLFLISREGSKEKPVEFLIPSREKFIWFLPEGRYSLKSSPQSDIGFLPKTINIKDDNVSIYM